MPLAEQDRARWDRPAIAEGLALVTASLAKGGHALGSGRNPRAVGQVGGGSKASPSGLAITTT